MEKKIKFVKLNDYHSIKGNINLTELGKTVLLKTIQIKGQDPSNFSLEIKIGKIGKLVTNTKNLSDYRTKFITEHKDYFILDISKMKEFQDYDSNSTVEVTIKSIEDFENIDIELYYSLEDPKPPIKTFLTR